MALLIGKASETEIAWMRTQGWDVQDPPPDQLLKAVRHPEIYGDPEPGRVPGWGALRLVSVFVDEPVFEVLRNHLRGDNKR